MTVRRRRRRCRRLVKVHSINFMIFIKRNSFSFFGFSLVRNKWRQLYAIISPGRWLTLCVWECLSTITSTAMLNSCIAVFFYCYRTRFWINYIFLLDVPILLLPNNTTRNTRATRKNWISFLIIDISHRYDPQILIAAISHREPRDFGGARFESSYGPSKYCVSTEMDNGIDSVLIRIRRRRGRNV